MEQIYNDEKWEIISPDSFEEILELTGGKTNWEISYPGGESSFDIYKPIYVIINKASEGQAGIFGFSNKNNTFIDGSGREMNIDNFLSENPELEEVLSPIMRVSGGDGFSISEGVSIKKTRFKKSELKSLIKEEVLRKKRIEILESKKIKLTEALNCAMEDLGESKFDKKGE